MIVYCCADLIFATKISSTCDSLGAISRPARNADMLQKRLDRVDDGKANDAVRVVLVDLEIGEDALELIEQAKQHASEVPVIAWGPHVAVQLLHQAAEKGADHVLARGSFTSQLPQIVKQYSTTN